MTHCKRPVCVPLCACVAIMACTSAPTTEPGPSAPGQEVQLNQGWSAQEIDFYGHATEGTNLAPVAFFLNLPDPSKPDSRFVDRLARDYGFIPGKVSALNPDGLPVGFAVDKRPAAPPYGDRPYVGVTCAACHTRQMTVRQLLPGGRSTVFKLDVHGGPSLADLPRFKQDLYDAFNAVVRNDDLAARFGQGTLGHAPSADEIKALRDEIQEFTGPVMAVRELMSESKIAQADFGPGNLNALTQGNYNNAGLGKWLWSTGRRPPTPPAAPQTPHFEGAVNYPPMWFAHSDDWAQWFAKIYHPGTRNWVQSMSSSEVRPPKMIALQDYAAPLGSIDFDNIARIQQSLELLRTPKWPAQVLGSLDAVRIDKGRALYQQQCASCHTRQSLPPNALGIRLHKRLSYDVGTDPTAFSQFAEGNPRRVTDLKDLADRLLDMRTKQVLKNPQTSEVAANYMNLYSRGQPDDFGMAPDMYPASSQPTWPRSGAAYWSPPLEGVFATSPYLHNGSVRSLQDLLTPSAQRPKTFRTGSSEFDAADVGLTNTGPFVYDTREPGKSNSGHDFGTGLGADDRAALVEYLKSL